MAKRIEVVLDGGDVTYVPSPLDRREPEDAELSILAQIHTERQEQESLVEEMRNAGIL